MGNTSNSTGQFYFRSGGRSQLFLPKGVEAIDGVAISTGSTTISAAFDSHRYAQARVSVRIPAAGTDTDSTFTLTCYTGNRLVGPAVFPARTMQTSSGAVAVTVNGGTAQTYVYPGMHRYFQLQLAEDSGASTAAASTGIFLDVEFN